MEGDDQNKKKTEAEPKKPAEPHRGWDPYEVWRTRVLLPRQEAATDRQALAGASPAPVDYVEPVAKPA